MGYVDDIVNASTVHYCQRFDLNLVIREDTVERLEVDIQTCNHIRIFD